MRKKRQTLVCPRINEKSREPKIQKVYFLLKKDNVLFSQVSNKTGSGLLPSLVVQLKNQNKKINVRTITATKKKIYNRSCC